MPNNLNFVFFGTPSVASETLEILKQNGFLPSLIVTAIDKPQGRKMLLTPPPVKTWAIENNIPYTQDLKDLDLNNFKNTGLFIVVAYGKILSEEIINTPKFGSINIHYSLLPKYRGASPVESAILNGDMSTGVAIQQMVYKMDAGDIIALEETDILHDEKAPELRERLIKIGGELLVKTLPDILNKKITLTKQDETQASFCKKIKKEDGLVDLEKENAQTLYNKFRAYSHWPRIYFIRENKRVIISDAILENNEFKILKVIPEGHKETKFIE